MQGKKKKPLVRMVTTMQAKCIHIKGCVLFAIHISSENGKEVEEGHRCLEEVSNFIAVLGCVPDIGFRVPASQGSGIFCWVGTRVSAIIKGTIQDEHTKVSRVEVVVEGNSWQRIH